MGTITTLRAFPGLGQPPLRSTNSDVHVLPPELSNTRRTVEVVNGSTALEKLAHLTSQVCALWNQREFEGYVNGLIMDSRDGKRQGLPWEAAQDLLFLLELSIAKRALVASEVTGVAFGEMYERCLAGVRNGGRPADPWSDPDVQKEVGHMGRDRTRSKPTSAAGKRAVEKKSWLRRVFG